MPARIQIDNHFRESWDARLLRRIIGGLIGAIRWIFFHPGTIFIFLLLACYLGAYLWGWWQRGTP